MVIEHMTYNWYKVDAYFKIVTIEGWMYHHLFQFDIDLDLLSHWQIFQEISLKAVFWKTTVGVSGVTQEDYRNHDS